MFVWDHVTCVTVLGTWNENDNLVTIEQPKSLVLLLLRIGPTLSMHNAMFQFIGC